GITRVHMEEDAGKSVHDRYTGATAIDLNRAGVPLIEIVSEPDMRSAAEAGAYLRLLKQILSYAGVSDVSMEEGSLRVDANVSARIRGTTKLGTKAEVKNVNSFSAVERALDAEFARQVALLQSGGTVTQQTMLWDGAKGETRPSRSKEESHDYRYFPEPDLPPLVLDGEWVARVGREIPELPDARRKRLAGEFKISGGEAELLTASAGLSEYYEAVARASLDPKSALNWVMGEVSAAVNAAGARFDEFPVRPADLAELLRMVRDDVLSHTAAKRVFTRMVETGKPAAQIAAEEGLQKVGDDSALEQWIDEVLRENPTEAARYKGGEAKLQGVLVGLVMKKSKGTADPRKVNQLLPQRARQ
ncbi:MAG TPA: Asp-tRNA(Asn)/Glu-tRNA(Gln) amidotransferase subunit GatB, partial [Gemmatimonadaceae bacterium]|nr:Asp-tRNA(Asn)/Glu-tRNA(Gln) amidotransferase subunit GatB [Gemmatimonadaceae bacterium]